MNRITIELAIQNAKRGIGQYLEIMDALYSVDVSENIDFQRKYNHFYRVRRPKEWREAYYRLMESGKYGTPSFDQVLDEIRKRLERYEPSFSSKLVATIDPRKPVWDVNVLKNTGHKAPSYTSKSKFMEAKSAYKSIVEWYDKFLNSETGKIYISMFNDLVEEHATITDLKKVDFILWRMRA